MSARAEDDKKLNTESVANPAGEFLKYVGSNAYSSPHRSPGFTMSFYATFEAVKPGSFNLSVGARVTGELPLGFGRGGGVPVIIVERGAPLTLLASAIRHRRRGFPSCRATATTTPLSCSPATASRPVPRYSVPASGGRETGGKVESDPAAAIRQVAPVISMRPFYVNPEDGFNQLMVDYLPVKNPTKAP